MNKELLIQLIEEEYKTMMPLIQKKQKLIKEIKNLQRDYVDYNELEKIPKDEIQTIWINLIGGEIPDYNKILSDLYQIAKKDGLNIHDIKHYAEKEPVTETNGLGISYTVKKSAPQQKTLKQEIKNIIKQNFLK